VNTLLMCWPSWPLGFVCSTLVMRGVNTFNVNDHRRDRPDMSRSPTAARLASWAAACPGANKSGGKSNASHTRCGSRWLKAALGVAAMGAIRTKNSNGAAGASRRS
jgi:hypothetical protein